MSGQTIFSGMNGRHLFRLRSTTGDSEATLETTSPAIQNQAREAYIGDELVLDLGLKTCVHGKLNKDGDFASLLVFSLAPATNVGDQTQLSGAVSIHLDFSRETSHENDIIEILQTGQDISLTTEIQGNREGVSWSTRSIHRSLRFGVLIRRNFDGTFFGNFRLTPGDDSSRHSRTFASLRQKDEAEPILFNPSASSVGDDIDLQNLQVASIRAFGSLNATVRPDEANPSNDLSSTEMDNKESQEEKGIQSRSATLASDGTSIQSQDQAKGKNVRMYHHMQRHLHQPHHAAKGRGRSPLGQNMKLRPLRSDDEGEEEVWTDPVRYITTHEMGFSIFGMHMTLSGVRCIRSVKMKLVQTNGSGEIEEYESTGHMSMCGMLLHKQQYHDESNGKGQDRYLVVGRMATKGFMVRERIFRYPEHDEEQMLRRLHKAITSIRGMRGFFSLKSVSGFGLYRCDPVAGYHTRAVLTESQRGCLSSFYNSYSMRLQGDSELHWNDWVFKHLNNSSNNPNEGKYSIEILLSWSVLRLAIVTSIPVALSLAVGFWYQTLPVEDGSDPTGTAWIIATYIITAGTLIIAFLGVATGLEQL